jgi:hypothetical protein
MRRRSGQALTEFAVLYAGVVLPLTFMIVFVSEMLWVWHSVVDFTRDGARYAATHCWMADASNVAGTGGYMPTHVPPMIDMDQFQTGAAGIQVKYYQADLTTGALTEFSCDSGDCSAACVPDAVSVSITSYKFTRFSGFFKLPAVTIPPFTTSVPMESAGCNQDPEQSGSCLP